MKMNKIISLILTIVMLVSCCAILGSCDWFEKESEVDPSAGLEGTYDITMWVSELDAKVGEDANGKEIRKSVVDLTKEQIQRFMETYPSIVINAEVSGVPEGDAASQVLTDVASAPDIYCFAQDQLARLVQATALAAPSDTIAERLKAANDASGSSAASVGGKMYAYPMTSDNGYYLYYDKSIVTDPSSLEKIIADIEAYNVGKDAKDQKNFRFALENAWYTASFFFATGCTSSWSTDVNGDWTGVNDTFNSEAGVAAMKGMMKLAQSSCYNSDADKYDNAAAWVNGIWNANTAQEHFGENFGVCKLPSFTVDGETYQLGSFSGNKLMGVKPQSDAKRAAVLSLLAQYLTNEQCQLERYELLQWGPSNLAAQNNDSVKTNLSLLALADQNKYATPQGNIHGSWWDTAKTLGAEAKTVKTDDDIKKALEAYQEALDGVFTMTDEQKMRWSVIGSVGGTNWDTDLAMTEVETGVWESDDYLEFTIGVNEKGEPVSSEFVMRRGADWNFKVGFGGEIRWDGEADIGNIVFSDFGVAAGKYKVRFTWDSDPEHNATVTLVPEKTN